MKTKTSHRYSRSFTTNGIDRRLSPKLLLTATPIKTLYALVRRFTTRKTKRYNGLITLLIARKI